MAEGLPPRAPSLFAATGSVAHKVAEQAFETGQPPTYFEGDKHTQEGFDIPVDEDMIAAVEVYTDYVNALKAAGYLVKIEQRVELAPLWSPDPAPEEIFGTADVLGLHIPRSELVVVDYKHGKGVPVEVEDNPQILTYGLGALLKIMLADKRNFPMPTSVRLVIIQPRAPHAAGPVRETELPALDLLHWGESVLKPGVHEMLSGRGKLVTGKHCRFCPGRAVCPALKRLALDTAKVEFGMPPEPANMDAAELSLTLDRADIIETWIAACRAEASQRIDHGQKIPGWKLVEKRAMRKWLDEDAVADTLRDAGYPDDKIFEEPSVRSVAQIEKTLRADTETMNRLLSVIEKKSSGSTLVADHDPRAAVASGFAGDDFSVVETGDG